MYIGYGELRVILFQPFQGRSKTFQKHLFMPHIGGAMDQSETPPRLKLRPPLSTKMLFVIGFYEAKKLKPKKD